MYFFSELCQHSPQVYLHPAWEAHLQTSEDRSFLAKSLCSTAVTLPRKRASIAHAQALAMPSVSGSRQKKKKVILYTNSLIFTDVYSFFIKAWLSRGWEAWAYINPWVRWGMGIWRCCYCPNYRLVVICYGCSGKVLAGTTCSYPGIGKRGVLGLKYPESSVANPGCPTIYYNRAMALCSGP